MFSLSRSLAFSLLIPAAVVMAVSTTTGCRKKNPKAEVHLNGRSGNSLAGGSGVGGGAWSPTGAPDGLGFGGSGSMGGPGGFGGGAGTDVTGSLLNDGWGVGIGDANFLSELEMIHFAYDSADIPTEWYPTLDQHAAWISSNPNVLISIEGHTDERGTEEYNLSLGQRRADKVREYWAGKGIDPNRLETVSYGKLRPMSYDGTEDGHSLNRRAQFLVYEKNNVASAQ